MKDLEKIMKIDWGNRIMIKVIEDPTTEKRSFLITDESDIMIMKAFVTDDIVINGIKLVVS